MNSPGIFFDPILPPAAAGLALLLLLVFFLIQEWRRSVSGKWLRVVCTCLLFISLGGLFFRPFYTASDTSTSIILLTKDFDRAKADSLQNLGSEMELWRTPEAEPYPGAMELESIVELISIGPKIKYLLGEGLPEYAFEYFEPSFVFIPSTASNGIVSLSINEAKSKRRNQLAGVFKGNERHEWLRLKGPDGTADSLALEAGAEAFSLAFVPKLPGRFLYTLQVLDSSFRTTDSLQVPVEVLPDRKLSILFIQQFPTFETRYLKNLLAGQGHSLALRYEVSQGEFSYEVANQPSFSFARISRELLEATDMVFITDYALLALPPSERNALREAVKGGLGVLVWLADVPKGGLKEWLPFSFSSGGSDTARIATDFGNASLSVHEFRIKAAPGTFSVSERSDEKPLAAYSYMGWGTTGTVLWRDSYRLVLNGRELVHASLWTEVIDAMARKESICCKLQWQSAPPHYADEPLHFRLLSNQTQPRVVYAGENVPLKESWQMENVWQGTIWPAKTGWDSLTVEGMDRPLYFYVNPAGHWKTLESAARRKATAVATAELNSDAEVQPEMARKQVPPLWFYGLFLLTAGGLWLAPKL